MLAQVLCLTLLATAPGSPRVALMPLSGGEGVTEKTAETVTDALAAELRRLGGSQLVTGREISAILSVERQKALLGCQDTSCMAEVAGALDADQVIVGSVARLGESWLLQLQRVDARKATTLSHANRRRKGGVDALLDELPQLAREVMGAPSNPVVVAPAQQQVAPAASKPLPAPHADVPLEGLDKAALTVVTDGGGRYLAFEPFMLTDGAFLHGSASKLHAQRVFGGGSEGRIAFSVTFWEPRARAPAQASFSFRDGAYTLTCGEKKISYRPLTKKETSAFLAKAKLFKPRWQRQAYALARDDDGNYFYVDQAREPEDNTDFRLYVGGKGRLTGHVAEALAHDSSGDVLAAAGGRLKLKPNGGEAEWIHEAGRAKLSWLPVLDNRLLIYGDQGPYAGLELGTPCDGHF
ncbi:MAG: hypothetical protein WBV82_16660 [Myxococcaceae bacterium]